ncbi:MAG: hypothetical protein IPI28_17800 [Candidatus Omnitrophica bacterium]|nr:hypothetical protein [Candidatus Omnitrophota bacterium]
MFLLRKPLFYSALKTNTALKRHKGAPIRIRGRNQAHQGADPKQHQANQQSQSAANDLDQQQCQPEGQHQQ